MKRSPEPPSQPLSTPRFDPGRVCATPGLLGVVSQDYCIECLERHLRGDWGIVCAEDAAANEQALIEGSRIFSVYPLNPDHAYGEGIRGNRLYIITEADRSYTTLMLPDEY